MAALVLHHEVVGSAVIGGHTVDPHLSDVAVLPTEQANRKITKIDHVLSSIETVNLNLPVFTQSQHYPLFIVEN